MELTAWADEHSAFRGGKRKALFFSFPDRPIMNRAPYSRVLASCLDFLHCLQFRLLFIKSDSLSYVAVVVFGCDSLFSAAPAGLVLSVPARNGKDELGRGFFLS